MPWKIPALRPRARSAPRCAVCHDDRDVASLQPCRACGTLFHPDCARRCPILGCEAAVASPTTVVISPAAFDPATTSAATAAAASESSPRPVGVHVSDTSGRLCLCLGLALGLLGLFVMRRTLISGLEIAGPPPTVSVWLSVILLVAAKVLLVLDSRAR